MNVNFVIVTASGCCLRRRCLSPHTPAILIGTLLVALDAIAHHHPSLSLSWGDYLEFVVQVIQSLNSFQKDGMSVQKSEELESWKSGSSLSSVSTNSKNSVVDKIDSVTAKTTTTPRPFRCWYQCNRRMEPRSLTWPDNVLISQLNSQLFLIQLVVSYTVRFISRKVRGLSFRLQKFDPKFAKWKLFGIYPLIVLWGWASGYYEVKGQFNCH